MARLKIWDAGTSQWKYVDCNSSGPTELDQLTDVVITGVQNSQHLVYFSLSGQWYNTNFDGGMLSIGIPGDGSYSDGLVSLTTNTILSTALDSINEAILGISGQVQAINPSLSLSDLTDVSISGVQNGQILRYFSISGQWFNTRFCASDLPICLPTDGSWSDGINPWTAATTTSDALDDLNETLSYLAPADAGPLGGALVIGGLAGGPYTGRISRGNANYKVNEATDGGSSIAYILASSVDTIWTLASGSTSTTYNKADEGFTRWYHGIGTGAYSLKHSVNHSTLFSEGSRAGSQTITEAWRTNQLKVTSVGWYNSFPKWQKGNATIDISGTLLSSGYNRVKMSREGSFTTQETSDYEIFYDDSSTTMVASTPLVTEATKVSGQLSGVSHYVRTSTFNVSGQITNVFRNTYLNPPVQLVATADSWMGTENLSVFPSATDGAYLNVSSPPFLSENARFNNRLVTVSSSNIRSIDARVTCQSSHPFRNVVSTASASQGRLINGYLNNAAGTASDTAEPFDNEWFRLLSNFNIDSISYSAGATGGWNSNIYLTSATSGYSDGLQIYNGGLKYPTQNYTSGFLPTTGQPNYSGATGTRVYIRYYYVGAGRQNFTWSFSNVSGTTTFVTVGTALTGNNVTFEMLAPATTKNGGGTTVWKDCMTAYTTDTAVGCYTSGTQSSSSSNWVTTLGTKSTSTSGNVICIRISSGASWGGVLGSLNVSAS